MLFLNKEALGTQTRAPEIIVEGETGFIVEDIDRAVEAVEKIEQLSRARCRREFEERFTDRHIAKDCIRIYQQLLSRSTQVAA
jgi:glycosyltransferase involved in cell wall biosynthesis